MKILVAEDNPESRHLLLQYFNGHGHEVLAAGDGREALALLAKQLPDVIVSDALMPGVDGFQLCRAVKQHTQWYRVPFIFYTATYTDTNDEQFARRIGADEFIVKPIDLDQLSALIEKTITRVRTAPASGPVSTDPDPAMLEEYNRRLSLKLEVKVAELTKANTELQASGQSIRQLNQKLLSTIAELEQQVTERKTAETALRFREEVLSAAQSIGHIGSYERDLRDTRMNWSDEAFRICGYEPGTVEPDREWIASILHPDDRERVLSELRQSDEQLSGFELEHRLLRPDGTTRYVYVKRHVVNDAHGRPSRFIGTIQDITDRKNADAQRAKLEAQLRQAQKMEAVGNLAGGIAHDFNNILTAIMAHAELLDLELPRGQANAHLHDSVAEILNASQRARDVVKQILTFSRKQAVERKKLTLEPIVRDAIRLVRATLPPIVELRPHLQSVGQVLANESQLHQVILNLCTNAAHAMGERGGLITIELKAIDLTQMRQRSRPPIRMCPHVCLEVRDTGCGMDAPTIERIFEPFFTTKPIGQGTGLGLAVVHGIIQAHEGMITVDSALGQGTTFTILLPQVSGDTDKTASTPATVQTGGGQKILFVDDEPSVAKIGARLLERLGYTAVSLTDPVAARDRLVNNPDEFDLVITDYLMPRVTGLDLSKAAWAVRPDLPMILAMGFGGQFDGTKAKAHGFKEFVAKPFAIQTLADAITRALKKQSQ